MVAGILARRNQAAIWAIRFATRSYFPVSPADAFRTSGEMLLTMAKCGVAIEKHHHGGNRGQCELGVKFAP